MIYSNCRIITCQRVYPRHLNNSYLPLSNQKFILIQFRTDGAPNFVYTVFQLPTRSVFACIFYTIQTKYPLMYWKDSINLYSNLEKFHMPNLTLLESQISLVALIQVNRPQTYDKRTFRSFAHWHFLLNELRPQKCKVSGITQKHRAAKLLPAGQLKDVLLRLKLVKALTAITQTCCFT
jgi:hypothetical protein